MCLCREAVGSRLKQQNMHNTPFRRFPTGSAEGLGARGECCDTRLCDYGFISIDRESKQQKKQGNRRSHHGGRIAIGKLRVLEFSIEMRRQKSYSVLCDCIFIHTSARAYATEAAISLTAYDQQHNTTTKRTRTSSRKAK